ncbi:glycoside hydrolase family 9 protein [Kutzneria sp. CA-103260]|uniref:glycoside hydrolase family 9 protein n=1 Tax=Kutzneria sp. CA-103260 TaxID=2802641 RepID=UPI001BAD2C3D|nr:glycoside hydrolase family 9 protein [Kutzneria sp. CA-103260]QUQ68697.1 hydrolase [Kutzneria sp. CA-103260]
MRVATVAIAAMAAVASVSFAVPAAAATVAQIRVDEVGYATGEAKAAYLMGTTSNAGAAFTVTDSSGKSVLTGKVGASTGKWSSAYPAVYPIDLSALRTVGTYQIKVGGTVSPSFRVDSANALFAPLADDTVQFFQMQRDGSDVIPGIMNRKPSHLTDQAAAVYDVPKFDGETITSKMTRTGVTVDASGGWFDAGDFLKFTATASYSVVNLLLSQRVHPSAALNAEARYGLDYLGKMWDAKNGVLYAQVGIGIGSTKDNFVGDHEVWRLPEADDALNVKPGDKDYYIKYRPVFAANKPGDKISPNLAGRMAAAFALAAQNLAATDQAKAMQYLATASSIYALANTAGGSIVSVFPHEYYPESSYLDDLELGAAELALAGQALGDSRATGWATDAGKYAKAYIASSNHDSLNLYDTSALGHADLVKLLRRPDAPKLAVTEAQLTGDLARQLSTATAQSAKSPFHTGWPLQDGDGATHTFGLMTTALLYGQLTGKHDYDAFATQQRDYILGSNAWGISMLIGAGNSPKCVHNQVANLSGSLTGGAKVAVGGVASGPTDAHQFDTIDPLPDGYRECSDPSYKTYDSSTVRYLDNILTWATNEPADDYTSTGTLALSLAAAG